MMSKEEQRKEQRKEESHRIKENEHESDRGYEGYKEEYELYDPEELLDVVDEKDEVIGVKSKKEIWEQNILHRQVAVYLIDRKKRKILLQLRADNNRWAHSAGGHVRSGESYERGAVRESKEELGILLKPEDLKEIAYFIDHRRRNGKEYRRFIKVFFVDDEKIIDETVPGEKEKKEVESVKYFSIPEIEELISEKNTTESTAEFLRKYIIPIIQSTPDSKQE